MDVAIIISTYNKAHFLELVFVGLSVQTHKNFKLYIADDGSSDNTPEVIENAKKQYGFNIEHVWHPDNGFQKTLILNKAIKRVKEPYVIFLDGDVIPQPTFVELHALYAKKGRYISSGALHLTEPTSNAITKKDILEGSIFTASWLIKNHLPKSKNLLKLNNSYCVSKLLNALFFFNGPTLNGNNSSVWLKDLVAVGGLDTRMGYGAEDRELGTRLENAGIKGMQFRYLITGLHLYHTRPYKNEEIIAANRKIWDKTKREKIRKTPYGLSEI